MGSAGGPSLVIRFQTKLYTGNSELLVTIFLLFSICWVWASKYEFSVSCRLVLNGKGLKTVVNGYCNIKYSSKYIGTGTGEISSSSCIY